MKTSTSIRFIISVFLLMNAGGYLYGSSLEKSEVKNFISSTKEMNELVEEYKGLNEIGEDAEVSDSQSKTEIPDNVISKSVKQTKGHEAHNRAEKIVQNHGFQNLDHWAETGDQIVRTYASIRIEEEDIQSSKREAMQQIEDNPHIDEAQKQALKQMVEGEVAEAKSDLADDVSEGDKNAVQPYMDELRELLEG